MLDDHNISTNQLSFCRLVSIPLALYVCMYYRVDGVHGDVYSSSVIQNVIAHKGRPIALSVNRLVHKIKAWYTSTNR